MKLRKQKLDYFAIIDEGNTVVVKFLQPFVTENLAYFDKLKPFDRSLGKKEKVVLDFTQIDKFDTSFVLFVLEFRQWAESQSIQYEITVSSERANLLLEKLSDPTFLDKEPLPARNLFFEYFENIGNRVKFFFKDIFGFIEFFGDVLIKFIPALFKPKKVHWEDLQVLFIRNGVGAVPIVSLILLLIGIISGYQGALQLKQFGADIFIADLIGVSITRELGPLMTAILVAGRSGSAFAAEIGTMKVSEEIDALRSMGFDPVYFLAIPRIYAVTLSIPFLTLIANLAGIIGGLISGLSLLNITYIGFFTQLRSAVDLGDIGSGLLKSVIFGFLVATNGCYRGLQVSGGAESVGTFTTVSVVSSIFAIIIADTIFTFIFDAIGL